MLLLLLLRLAPLGGDFQPLRCREVGVLKLTLAKLDRYLVHSASVGDVVSFAGGVTDAGRCFLLLAPLLFSSEFVRSRRCVAATATSAATSEVGNFGCFRLHKSLGGDIVFLTEKFVSLVELALLREVGLICGFRCVVGLPGRGHPTGVWCYIHHLTCCGIGRVCIGVVAFHLACIFPLTDSGIVRGFVAVAGGFQPRSLLFEGQQLLLVFLNLGGSGSRPRHFDDGVAELVVSRLGLAEHYFLHRHIFEIVGI